LQLGCFEVGTFWGLGRFLAGTFYRWDLMECDVLWLGRC
jgi:hypothetical protein